MQFQVTNSQLDNICATCGTRYSNSKWSTDACIVCNDDRQYIGDDGQVWTSYEKLAKNRSIRFSQLKDQLYDLRITPAFAIGQKAHLVLSRSGNILWDCLPFVDEPSVAFIRSLGGLKAIAISHPHYYSLMVEWAKIFDCPVYLHAGDVQWVIDKDERIQWWEGGEKMLWDDIRIVHTAGHFPGSVVLHLPQHGTAGSLLTGDSIYVSKDRKQVSAMYSYPNVIPLPYKAIQYIISQVMPLEFDSLYGAFEWMNLHEGAKTIFQKSMFRYLDIVANNE
jgi:hypothetical protein